MRKTLLFTLLVVCLLLFTLPVSANSLFGDLPNTHWAYGAIKQLVAEDIISSDINRFTDGKRISRYEAAMLVANGYTKLSSVTPDQKALITKLGHEFKAELEKMGALPTTPTVKKEDKLNILIEQRLQMNNTSLGPNDVGGGVGVSGTSTGTINQKTHFSERMRIFFNAPIGDRWQWDARYYQQKYNLGADNSAPLSGNTNGAFDRFYVTGKNILGGTVEAGKIWAFPGKGTFFGTLGDTDGIFYSIKRDNYKVRLGTAKVDWALNGNAASTDLNFIEASYKPTPKSDIGGYWLTHDKAVGIKDLDLITINGAMTFDNGHALSFEWAKNRASNPAYNNKTGYAVAYQSHYRNTWRMPMVYDAAINPFKQGDSAWAVSYRHMPAGVAGDLNRGASNIAPMSATANGYYINNFNDVNAWRLDYYYVPWKNVAWALVLENAKDIRGRWTNNVIQTVFLFYFK